MLLDTHSFLWFIEGSPRLSVATRELIAHRDTERFLSIATLWEMAIKISLGRLESHGDFASSIQRMLDHNHISLIGITVEVVAHTIQLPYHHRDPFDRILIAQALTHRMSIVSDDQAFDAYGVHRIW